MQICDVCGFTKNDVKQVICPVCGGTNWNDENTNILKQISSDTVFLKAMNDLAETDPIEFQLKMSQFRNQLEQLKQMEQVGSNGNTPRCPYCSSTNLKKISTGEKVTNIALFGLLGNKRKYQWHCNSCKSDF